MAEAATPAEGLRVGLVLATSTGGVGRHVRSLATGLLARGAHVMVCGPEATDRLFGFAAAGAEFRPVPIATGARPLSAARAVLTLRAALRDREVVHAHGLRAGLVAGVAVPRRTPYVVTWHNAVLGPGPLRGLAALGERVVARRADVTLAASADLVARVRALGGRDVRLGEVAAPDLGAPARAATEVRAELGAGERPLVLAVGRLHPQKGFDTLVAAAGRLAGRVPGPIVAIAGDGPLRTELAALAAAAGAPVRLLGARSDVADLLAAADVAVLPSVWEARALAAQEALRAGVPLVATAVGGLPDLVGDAAVLVPPGDPVALADAIARVLEDPALQHRLRAAGPARAARWPDEDDTVSAVSRLYLELRDSPEPTR